MSICAERHVPYRDHGVHVHVCVCVYLYLFDQFTYTHRIHMPYLMELNFKPTSGNSFAKDNIQFAYGYLLHIFIMQQLLLSDVKFTIYTNLLCIHERKLIVIYISVISFGKISYERHVCVKAAFIIYGIKSNLVVCMLNEHFKFIHSVPIAYKYLRFKYSIQTHTRQRTLLQHTKYIMFDTCVYYVYLGTRYMHII